MKTTWFGDPNLDGQFSTSDFVSTFIVGQYEDNQPFNSTWVSGDWNGDGDFNSGDIVFVFQHNGFEQGTRPVKSVPEPSAMHVFAFAVLLAPMKRARSKNGHVGSLKM